MKIMEIKNKIFEEFLRWWLLQLNDNVKPMSEPTLPNVTICYFDFKYNE